MTHTITALDGTDDTITPDTITEYSADQESGNVVHRLLAPGNVAVTLVGDLPRSGSLRLGFSTDTAAAAARALLARPSAFALSSTSRPIVDMTFVREGRMTTTARNGFTGRWEFSVGFHEVGE